MMKKTIAVLYIALIVCMASATFLEKIKGTDYATTAIYGAWWFSLLWALLAGFGLFYLHKRLSFSKHRALCIMHYALVIILVGAFISHVSSRSGRLHLHFGDTMTMYECNETGGAFKELPFTIRLDTFVVKCYKGTQEPVDYVSSVTVTTSDGRQEKARISMNHIFQRDGLRLYQTSYDAQDMSSVLTVYDDPVGIATTYVGYALLFLSFIWLMVKAPSGPSPALPEGEGAKEVTGANGDSVGGLTSKASPVGGRLVGAIIVAVLAWLIYYFNVRYMATHHVMPVLRTPFFGVHVGLMIVGYGLSAIIFLLSVAWLIIQLTINNYQLTARLSRFYKGRRPTKRINTPDAPACKLSIVNCQLSITRWCRRLLIPALGFTAGGIFVGAIWANVSWGRYWGWDPKETWALISLMVWAVPAHTRSLPAFRNPRTFHLYLVLALLFIAFTYFGVNALLTGMHSYA